MEDGKVLQIVNNIRGKLDYIESGKENE